MPKNNQFPVGKEDVYRLLDGLYRIHDDLFHVEDEISRFAFASLSVAKLRSNTIMGALTAGLLTIVPILVAVLDIKWSSTPALVILLVVTGVLVLWIYQAFSTKATEKKLGFIASSTYRAPLERRHDYLQEIIATWGNRKRVLEEVILELEEKYMSAGDSDRKSEVSQRLSRYKEISDQCLQWIKWAIDTSAECVEKGQRSEDEHAEILDWASPFLTRGEEAHGRKKSN